MKPAAIYCRSSKDRAEVGLDVQRKDLHDFAKAQGLKVVAEFSDMEVSGSLDEVGRPGLRELLVALAAPDRVWGTLLLLDTSRLARDPTVALYVTRECEKKGVAIQYAKAPLDGATAYGEAMLNVMRSFDRLHARLSAEKGRAGAEANIARGFRAGGRAPLGYRLEHHDTGAVRGGKPVLKSRLVIDTDTAPSVKAFLGGRAEGQTRAASAKAAGLQKRSVASLIGIEKNALLYAGFTVWNQRRKIRGTRDDERTTMEPRPRAEWVISDEPTHEALITRAEAERILALHEYKPAKKPRVCKPEDFLLAGLLFTPDGRQWTGDNHDHCYRIRKGQRVNARQIDHDVIRFIAEDFADPAFLAQAVREARAMAEQIEAEPEALEKDIRKRERQISNLVDLVAETGGRALVDKLRKLEAEVEQLKEAKASWTDRAALKRELFAFSAADIRAILSDNALDVLDPHEWGITDMLYPDGARLTRGELRRLLAALVERIELDPDSREVRVFYRLPVKGRGNPTGTRVASPRGFEPRSPP